jgi:hypothetical protein
MKMYARYIAEKGANISVSKIFKAHYLQLQKRTTQIRTIWSRFPGSYSRVVEILLQCVHICLAFVRILPRCGNIEYNLSTKYHANDRIRLWNYSWLANLYGELSKASY